MNDVRPWLYNLLLLAFLGLLGWGLWKSPAWGWPQFVVCIVAAGFVALLGNMDRLESFKAGAGGIEARTREVKAVVAKAESAITELQELAEVTVGTLFELLNTANRLGGFSAAERDSRKREMLAVLDRLGVSDERQSRVREGERRWVIVDYVSGITRGLPTDAAHNEQWTTAWLPWKSGVERPSPDQLRDMLRPEEPLAPWRAALLEDYKHYVRTGTHRRPTVWAARDEWYSWTYEDRWPAEDEL